jgi:hypothetical protein
MTGRCLLVWDWVQLPCYPRPDAPGPVHRGLSTRPRGSCKHDRTFDSTEGHWVVMHKQHEGSRAVLVGDASFPPIEGLRAKAALGTYYPLIYPSTMLGCTIDCSRRVVPDRVHDDAETVAAVVVGEGLAHRRLRPRLHAPDRGGDGPPWPRGRPQVEQRHQSLPGAGIRGTGRHVHGVRDG